MTQLVAIFDIVVNERVVVEDLDRDGRIERVLERCAFARRHAHDHLRAQALAAPRRSVRAVTEVAQKHIGDLARSPISGNPFLEGALEAFG